MSGGSLGLRSGSYGSLQQQLKENGIGVSQIQLPTRKASKMIKEKESLIHWICKFAGRKKVGMLLLCLVSAAVFLWMLYIGKGEDTQQNVNITHIDFNSTVTAVLPPPLVVPPSVPDFALPYTERSLLLPPPPPAYFLGYTLPPGHQCNSFTLPPPPADKKRTGPRPCPVCYLPVEEAIALMPGVPSFSPVLKNLTYVYEENLTRTEDSFGGSDFGGYPSWDQRNDSFNIRDSMSVHCGFVKGVTPGHHTGFDMDDSDLIDMHQCHGVVVASAIFGNFDEINQPKNISDFAKQNVCFYMFVDEETEAYLKNSSRLDSARKVGVWRVVVIHNPPYTDARRTGKIPKLLMHRIFPNARYSIWIDGKLELVVDPYQILERFLWRKNATFAISRHYKRFDVFMEAEANKAAGKYDNASIDFQVEFYKKEGLTPYSEAKLPITSDVPEGCVIIREHVPISNLFTCLWFNEVDRFTSRDQISFSTVRDKIMAQVNWNVNMFWDCERRNFVVQKYHKDLLEHLASPIAIYPPPPPPPSLPPVLVNKTPSKESPESVSRRAITAPTRRSPVKRGRDRRSGSRRHRKVAAGNRETDSG